MLLDFETLDRARAKARRESRERERERKESKSFSSFSLLLLCGLKNARKRTKRNRRESISKRNIIPNGISRVVVVLCFVSRSSTRLLSRISERGGETIETSRARGNGETR